MRWRRIDVNAASKRWASDSPFGHRAHGRLSVVSNQAENNISLVGHHGDDAIRGELHFWSILLVAVAIVIVRDHGGGGRRSSSCDGCVVRIVLTLTLILRLSGAERDSAQSLFRISSPVCPCVNFVIHFDNAVDNRNLLALRAGNVDGPRRFIAMRTATSSVVESSAIFGSRSSSSSTMDSALTVEAFFRDEEIDHAEKDVEKDENCQDDGDDEIDGGGLALVG